MKKYLIAGLSVLFVALALVSCGSEEPKPEPKPQPKEKVIEVLLNGHSVKNNAEVVSKDLKVPEMEGFDYDFVNYLSFKVNDDSLLGKYTFEASKLGGDEVLGFFAQVCEGTDACYPVKDNSIKRAFDIKKVNEETAAFSLYYRLGMEKPTKAVKADLLVKLLRDDKVIHQFTIKMTYNP